MARGYTHLEGPERVTMAFQKVFGFMEAKEQREDKIQRNTDALIAEEFKIKAAKALKRRRERIAKRK